MSSKKGQGLSIETLVLIVVAIIVLALIILIFTGEAGIFFDAVGDFISQINTPEINPEEIIR